MMNRGLNSLSTNLTESTTKPPIYPSTYSQYDLQTIFAIEEESPFSFERDNL
jgi:hypothetical protein